MHIPVEESRLANGLRVVLSRDPSNPVVAVNLWYNVGSRNERPGRTGFAHLFEHMMFQGSEHVPGTEHIAHVQRVGGTVNGSTWLDRTNYYETLPASELELALWLEADRMGFLLPAMTPEKLDNQRSVVQNERRWRVDNQPYGDWDERIQAMVFPPNHPYHHSVIGSMEDLRAATLSDVESFFRTFYSPSNAVLTLCGDFDPGRARSLVERYFGSIPRGPDLPPLPGNPEAPPQIGGEIREQVEGDLALPRVYLAFRIPPYTRDGFYPAEVTAHLLAAGKSSRLYRSLVREQRIAQDVAAFAFPVVTGASVLVIWATASPTTTVEQVEWAVRAEIEVLQRDSPSDAEIARVVTGIEAQHIVGLQQVGERADQLSMFATLFGDPGRINTELERYRTVTGEAVRRFALEYLNGENRAVLTYLPRHAREAA